MDTDDIYEIPYKTFDYHYVHLHESIIMYRYIFTSQSLRTSTSSRVNHYVHLHESIITYRFIFTSQSLPTSSRVNHYIPVHLHESIITYIFTSQSLRTSTSSRVNHKFLYLWSTVFHVNQMLYII